MQTRYEKNENGDLEITFIFDKCDQICLEHDLIDIVDWYKAGPTKEKIENCKKRLINENKEILMKKNEFQGKTLSEINSIFDDEKSLVFMIRNMPEYKNRLERERDGESLDV